MLKQHEFYVYYEGASVFARAGKHERVLMAELKTPQEAHDLVQTIVNPDGHNHLNFSQPDAKGNTGFHHESFQGAISKNCEAAVRKAYQEAGVTL